ncbi:MAG: UDP-N-acetylmuramate dehydrogenase [Candidatus Berkelbacteria bacterium]
MNDLDLKMSDYFGDKIKYNEPLNDKVSLKVGGVADYYIEAKTVDDISRAIRFCFENKVPYFVLGGGYNILPADAGFQGMVIKNNANEAIFSASSSEVIVESGISIGRLINLAAGRDLGGLEFMFGIPGTVGGAIYGNAGAFGHEIGDFVKSATILVVVEDRLETRKVDRSWFHFAYRESSLKKESKRYAAKPIILTVTLQLARRRKDEILSMMKECLDKKKKTQPLDESSAGSFFKNPGQTKEMSAGYLIEKVGGKKMKVGGSAVSSKHANFLVNKNNASAKDIQDLAAKIKETVAEKYNVKLEEEIEYIGNW